MPSFKLNQQLKNDCHYLMQREAFHLLLHKNATIPWMIIVPITNKLEVYELTKIQQLSLNQLIKNISRYLKTEFKAEKMNTAAIGNIVSQLHIHVIGRKASDACWPNVVWGNEYPFIAYSQKQTAKIQKHLAALI